MFEEELPSNGNSTSKCTIGAHEQRLAIQSTFKSIKVTNGN